MTDFAEARPYSDDEAVAAERVVAGLLEGEQHGRVVERLVSDSTSESTLSVEDLRLDLWEFQRDLATFARLGLSAMPAAMLPNDVVIPIALGLLPNFLGVPSDTQPSEEFPPRELPGVDRSQLMGLVDRANSLGVPAIPLAEARQSVLRRGTDFLATRLAGLRALRTGNQALWENVTPITVGTPMGGTQSTPGCLFTVTTNSSGLRVFWSGAYRLSANYLNAPTSPAAGILQSGRYLFGVDGLGYGTQIQWDQNAMVTLPGPASAHLNY